MWGRLHFNYAFFPAHCRWDLHSSRMLRQRRFVVCRRRFVTTYRSHLQGPSSSRRLTVVSIGCSETSITDILRRVKFRNSYIMFTPHRLPLSGSNNKLPLFLQWRWQVSHCIVGAAGFWLEFWIYFLAHVRLQGVWNEEVKDTFNWCRNDTGLSKGIPLKAPCVSTAAPRDCKAQQTSSRYFLIRYGKQ